MVRESRELWALGRRPNTPVEKDTSGSKAKTGKPDRTGKGGKTESRRVRIRPG